jgi:hypothetical protein
MNPILQGLQSGYSPEDIIKYISKAIPQMGAAIKKASRSGYGPQQILGFLSKNFETESREGKSESERHAINRRADAERVKYGLKAAATTVGAAVATPLAASAAKGVLSRALPSSLQAAISPNPATPGIQPPGVSQSPQIPNQSSPNAMNPLQSASAPTSGMPQAQNLQQPSAQQPPGQVAPSVTQPSTPTQAKGSPIDSGALISKHASKDQIDKLISSGNGADEVAGFMQKFKPKEVKAIEKEAGQPIEKVIEDYIAKNPKQPEAKIEMDALPGETAIEAQKRLKISYPAAKRLIEARDKNISPEKVLEEQLNAAKPTIAKGSLAVSPDGIGEVKEIRNGKVIIEIDGKKHKVDESDLEPPSFSDDEVADAYDNLMAKIPEEHRSGMISWAGYDENRNVLGYIPRGGKYEEMHNITPEEAQKIKEGSGTARTSGEVREGLWVAGEETRGGVISQIYWDRRKKHEAEEKNQLKLGFELPKKEKEDKGMKPIFDEMGHARGLSQERDKKKKLEERAKKKAEKDEAKKRKKKQA